MISGNRNFEGRIQPLVRANYLASPPLVVAYALAGTMDIDLYQRPIGEDSESNPVFLRDLWPTATEVQTAVRVALGREMFREQYANVFDGDVSWQSLAVPEGNQFFWDSDSTYVKRPPFFEGLAQKAGAVEDLKGVRTLVVLGDSVTTDHISPAGHIPADSPAGKYLIAQGVDPKDFNSYGSRRGNHDVMIRGTFANTRFAESIGGGNGGRLHSTPTGWRADDDLRCGGRNTNRESVPLMILAGKEYGSGSSRDWAAKGTRLLGVQVVIAESYERIHRSNLVGMGVLPLQYEPGETAAKLGLTGREIYQIENVAKALQSDKKVTVLARNDKGEAKTFPAVVRIDTPEEALYYQNGGILQYVLRQLI